METFVQIYQKKFLWIRYNKALSCKSSLKTNIPTNIGLSGGIDAG